MNCSDYVNDTNCNLWIKGSLLEVLTLNSSYLHLLPPHWLREQFPPTAFYAVVGVLFSVFCALNNVCAFLVIIVFVRKRNLRTPSNCLLISLILADVVLLITCYIIIAQVLLGHGSPLWGVTGTLGSLAEIWSLSAVAVDRFKSMHYPLQTNKRLGKRQVQLIILSIWLVALGFALGPLLGWNAYKSEAFLLGCTFDLWSPPWSSRSYVLVLVMLAWAAPLALVTSSYLGIVGLVKDGLMLKEWRRKLSSSTGSQEVNLQVSLEQQQQINMERTLAGMVCSLLVLWIMAWTPYAMLSMWILLLGGEDVPQAVAFAPIIACKLSATLNAFLYGIRLPKFAKEINLMWSHVFRNYLQPCCGCLAQGSSSGNATQMTATSSMRAHPLSTRDNGITSRSSNSRRELWRTRSMDSRRDHRTDNSARANAGSAVQATGYRQTSFQFISAAEDQMVSVNKSSDGEQKHKVIAEEEEEEDEVLNKENIFFVGNREQGMKKSVSFNDDKTKLNRTTILVCADMH